METSIFDDLINVKKELQIIKTMIITEEKLKQIIKEGLDLQENKYKNGLGKIQRQIIQIKLNNNTSKKALDFSDFQMPPDLPWGKTIEPKKNQDKDKTIKQ